MRKTYCGVRDTNKAAGSFLPHWHFKNPIRYWLYTEKDAPIATTGMIFVCGCVREVEKARGHVGAVKKITTERH